MNMYVSNLGFQITDDDLRNLFTTYGEVSSAKVVTDKITGKSRGFGFVEMPEQNDAENAIKNLSGSAIEGRTIVVSEAKPRSSNSFSGNSGGGRKPSKW